MADPILLLSIIKILTVVLGAVFLGITWRAYRRQPNRGMLVLFFAVALMTVAAVAEGLAFQALGFSLDQAHIIEGLFTLAGFAVLVYSVWSYRVR
ncbi:MAG: hypothetical protein AABY18_02070 [Candidatus Thermoplasmatota archaeon]